MFEMTMTYNEERGHGRFDTYIGNLMYIYIYSYICVCSVLQS